MNDMEKSKKELMREWVNNWKETGKVLEQLRREEIRDSITSKLIPVFDVAFRSAIFLQKPSNTSGFVEFYKCLGKTK